LIVLISSCSGTDSKKEGNRFIVQNDTVIKTDTVNSVGNSLIQKGTIDTTFFAKLN
jgi:hypothetical protein